MAQTAPVTIITKYGFKKPSLNDLQQGELGIDLLGKTLYTRDGSNQIIEVGGGTVDWGQIDPDSIPEEITNIIDGTWEIDVLIDKVNQNEGDITQLKADLLALDALVQENIRQIGLNAGRIDDNLALIQELTVRVGTNEGDIATNAGDIDDVEDRLDIAEPKIEKNIQDIADLQKIVDGDLTGLAFAGTYDVPNNQVQDVAATGTTAGISKGDTLDQHAKAGNEGLYFVCEGDGQLGGLFRESSNGEMAYSGDWLVCDGIHGWILMSFGGDHVAWGTIGGNIENQEDLQDALATKLEAGDTLDGGKFG